MTFRDLSLDYVDAIGLITRAFVAHDSMLVRYAVYLESLDKFSHLDLAHYVYLDRDVLFVQNDKIRTPTTVVERLQLHPSVTCLAKAPLAGFKWDTDGMTRKFQIKFLSEQSFTYFIDAISQYVVVSGTSITSITPEVQKQDVSRPAIALPLRLSQSQAAGLQFPEPGQISYPASIGQARDVRNHATFSNTQTSQFPDPYQSASMAFRAPPPSVVPELPDSSHLSWKMPTPMSQVGIAATSQAATVDEACSQQAKTHAGGGMSHDELGTRFAAFLKDDKNIQLCKAVEQFWTNSGMQG